MPLSRRVTSEQGEFQARHFQWAANQASKPVSYECVGKSGKRVSWERSSTSDEQDCRPPVSTTCYQRRRPAIKVHGQSNQPDKRLRRPQPSLPKTHQPQLLLPALTFLVLIALTPSLSSSWCFAWSTLTASCVDRKPRDPGARVATVLAGSTIWRSSEVRSETKITSADTNHALRPAETAVSPQISVLLLALLLPVGGAALVTEPLGLQLARGSGSGCCRWAGGGGRGCRWCWWWGRWGCGRLVLRLHHQMLLTSTASWDITA